MSYSAEERLDERPHGQHTAFGGDGYCIKGPTMNLPPVRTVAEGGEWLAPATSDCVLDISMRVASKRKSELQQEGVLSERELGVLRLVAEGLSNPEIAEHLCLGVETVKTHVRRIMQKLLVSDRTQAAIKALKQGLI